MTFRRSRTLTPYWLTARFGGKCSGCGLGIKKGEQAFYYPGTKAILCARDPCGKRAEADLRLDDFDISVMNQGGRMA